MEVGTRKRADSLAVAATGSCTVKGATLWGCRALFAAPIAASIVMALGGSTASAPLCPGLISIRVRFIRGRHASLSRESHELPPHPRARLCQPFAAGVAHLLLEVARLSLLQEPRDSLRSPLSARHTGSNLEERCMLLMLLLLHRVLKHRIELAHEFGFRGRGTHGAHLRGSSACCRGRRRHVLRVHRRVHPWGTRRECAGRWRYHAPHGQHG
mmetsp:Transcript_18111/g.28931  ORF Transcript_18111/g.28931 Transcript_18111/m.28931 type:complete len:213 (+) Transcript_18111:262-900(+)